MYQNAAILAVLGFVFVAVSAPVRRSWVSGPILFVAAGVVLGPGGLGLLVPEVSPEALRVLAELTLAMVLFTDAAKADLRRIRRNLGLPERLLLLGLPLTILLGLVAAAALFPALSLVEAALLAAILAPTDAALGRPVVTNGEVPAELRETLNFESGLNDGICVPVVLLLVGFAVETEIEGEPWLRVLRVLAEGIGIGLAAGVVLALLGTAILALAARRRWIAEDWRDMALVALAAACFATAQLLGGSGFVACFVGGLVLNIRLHKRRELLRGTESIGDGLSLLTWVLFGAGLVWQVMDRIGVQALVYAVASLTLVRMLPVWLVLAGARLKARDRLFLGWFGPRGLASVVFGILILDAGLPGIDTLEAVIVATVLLSVVAHGVSANPLIRRLAPYWRARRG